jgi:hypothetical protein
MEHRVIEIIFGADSPRVIKDFDICLNREKASGVVKDDPLSGARNI